MSRIWRLLSLEIYDWASYFVSHLPGRAGKVMRHLFFSTQLAHLGDGSQIECGIQFMTPSRIRIGRGFAALANCSFHVSGQGTIELGDDVTLSPNTVLAAGEGLIRIGRGSGIGHNGVLHASPHNYEDASRPWKTQGHRISSIVIEEDVWVAANVTLLPGTHLEKGCIVAAGSVVGGRFKAYSIIAGHPARAIGKRENAHPGSVEVNRPS